MKKLTVLLLVVMMVLPMAACGGSKSDNSFAGTYTLYAMDYEDGVIVLAEELFEGESYVTINKDGSAIMCLEGDEANVTWKA